MTGARRLVALALMLGTGGCEALRLGVINHAGPVAAGQWHLFLIVGAVLVFVAGPVLLLTPLIAWYYRLSNKHRAFKPDWGFSWPLEGFIWIPPVGIVIGLGFLLWFSTHDLDPYRPLSSSQPPLDVQVVALDWKWLFIYPDQRVAVVNRLAIPVGRPVRLRLTSGTVMQSLLIPRLAGQIYAMPAMVTQLNLAASEPGTFRGQNTQYNGDGFAKQKFDVVALPPAELERWLTRVRASARPFDAAAMTAMTKKSVPARPIFFSSVPPDLFQHFMIATRRPMP